MQLEILEGTHVQIIVGSRTSAAGGGTLPTLLDAAAVERPAPRSGRAVLKGCLVVLLLAASFAAGDYFGGRPHAPELTRAAAASPSPAVPPVNTTASPIALCHTSRWCRLRAGTSPLSFRNSFSSRRR
jgi:hypothetical protein